MVVVVVAGCGNRPPAPDWALNAEAAAQRAGSAYLQGQQRIETLQWQTARQAVASTGRPDQAARLELMRCAARVASLDWNGCTEYEGLAQDATAEEQAYARYLHAQPLAQDLALLPQAQRAVAARLAAGGSADDSLLDAVAAIPEPLSRLLAAAVLLRGGAASPRLLQLGVDTASSQGWRRPLMAWLLLQLKAAQQAGDTAAAAPLERRLRLLDASAPK
ncbi:hypothetical protein [Comamonas guangdongensis]|uniref:Uncharacterized protein n=1 Tax=Comamonas guangdongensis TaxID=510515 RepID=A0ABV3ZXH1_9BURK